MDSMRVWQEFLGELQKGPLPAAKIRPYHPGTFGPLLSNLNDHLRSPLLSTLEKKAQPECFASGSQFHYILPLAEDGVDFCFSFLVEDGQWYFQHMENIFIRLDQTGVPPVSAFPDLPDEKKAWARDEFRIFADVRLYRFLSEDKGKTFALSWFRDGEGYFLGARAWVPFLPPAKAFIFYVCWEWANLQHNPVTLVCLDETRAVIRARLRYFELYQRSSNIPQMISRADYYELFETIWKDRASYAGWNLSITYDADECTFSFKRDSGDGG
jgi:hypothetical protein